MRILLGCSLLPTVLLLHTIACSEVVPFSTYMAARDRTPIVPGEEFYITIVYEIKGGSDDFKNRTRILSLESDEPDLKVITKPIQLESPSNKKGEVRFRCILEKSSKSAQIRFVAKCCNLDNTIVMSIEFESVVKRD